MGKKKGIKKRISIAIAASFLLGSQSEVMTLASENIAGITPSMPTGDIAEFRPSKPLELLSSQEAQELDEMMASYNENGQSLLNNQSASYFYYDHLSSNPKQIYDVLFEVAQDPVSEGNIGFMMTDMDPCSDEFYADFNTAYRALCFDHPELFWLYSGEEAEMIYLSEAVNMGGFYFVYIKMDEPFYNFQEQMTEFNKAVDAFFMDIDKTGSDYDIVKQVHDKLINLVNYNDPVAEDAYAQLKGQDLAHTAYGALVSDSHGIANYAVCDGYTLALEYLLQQCGIEVAFIGGIAGASEADAGGHAWNIVKIEDQWYEIDSTWDDAGSLEDDLDPDAFEDQYYLEALNDPAYRDKLDHFLFLISTEDITHFVPGEEYGYITNDKMYLLQLVSESVHIRMGRCDWGSDCDAQIISLAPDAMQSYR